MLEDGPEPEPQPEPDDNAWMQAEVEAARARIAERALMDRAARPRPEPAARIDLGIGLTGARRIGTWDPVMRRYNIRDEQVPMHRLDRDPFDNF